MGEQMDFPETFERFAKEYGFKDDKEVYTNGLDLIPIFRVKQWLEHNDKLCRIAMGTAYECGKHANLSLLRCKDGGERMTLDELIKYCEEIAERNRGIAEFCKDSKYTTYKDGWAEEATKYFQIADYLKVLKDILNTGSCDECNNKNKCEYEPLKIARYNCPFYNEESEVK